MFIFPLDKKLDLKKKKKKDWQVSYSKMCNEREKIYTVLTTVNTYPKSLLYQ